jgi:hypothetical protein
MRRAWLASRSTIESAAALSGAVDAVDDVVEAAADAAEAAEKE